MDFPKVAIIVLNWNNWQDTFQCLKSLENLNYPNFEVIVVDNGSNEKFQITDYRLQIVQIFNKENLGFAGGNNVGIKQGLKGNADYILLLNNDTVVDKNFLKELIKVGENKKKAKGKRQKAKIGILGPKIYFFDEPKKIWFAGGKINKILTKGTMRGYSEFDKEQYNKIKEVDYITGCCLLIKQEVIKKIGLLKEDYFLYYEDTDWCLKAKKAGYKCLYVPLAKIWHKGSKTSIEGSFSYIYYHSRNGLLLAKNNGSFLKKLGAYFLSIWILAKQIIKLIFFPQKRIWARAVIKGIGDFYKGKYGKYDYRY